MLKFLFMLAVMFVLMLLLLGFNVARMFKRLFFGTPKHKTSQRHSASAGQQHKAASSTTPRKKLISKDEGEYVDYEEIKD
ncbi:MAG: DUF4834 family protein [Tannerella sp.]|jgi:hypothetical protein|nr:DUF4834 family protein [Tannerella sp.]